MILKQYISKFGTYEITLGFYSNKDIADALKSFGSQIRYDDISMNTSLLTDKILRFDISSFFNYFLGFSPYWDYKNDNKQVSQKITVLSTIDSILLKTDCFHGKVVNGVKKPKMYSFILNKPPGYKIFCSPETIQQKK